MFKKIKGLRQDINSKNIKLNDTNLKLSKVGSKEDLTKRLDNITEKVTQTKRDLDLSETALSMLKKDKDAFKGDSKNNAYFKKFLKDKHDFDSIKKNTKFYEDELTKLKAQRKVTLKADLPKINQRIKEVESRLKYWKDTRLNLYWYPEFQNPNIIKAAKEYQKNNKILKSIDSGIVRSKSNITKLSKKLTGQKNVKAALEVAVHNRQHLEDTSNRLLKLISSDKAVLRKEYLKLGGTIGAVAAVTAGGIALSSKLAKTRVNPDRYYVVCEDNGVKVVGDKLGYSNRNAADDLRESLLNAGTYKILRVNKGTTVIDKLGSVNFSKQYNFMREETKQKLKTAGKVAAGVAAAGALALGGLTAYNSIKAGSAAAGLAKTGAQLAGGARAVGSAVTGAGKYVANKATQAGKYVADKATKVGEFVSNKATDAVNYVKDGWNNTADKIKILDKRPPKFADRVMAKNIATKAASAAKTASEAAKHTAAARSAASAASAAAAGARRAHFSNMNFDAKYEKSTTSNDKSIPYGVAAGTAFGSAIVASDQLNRSNIRQLKKIANKAGMSNVTGMSKAELANLSKDKIAEFRRQGYEILDRKKGFFGKKAATAGRSLVKAGKLGLAATGVGLATAGAYKLSDKLMAMKDNYEKSKYVPDFNKIEADKYYVIDQASDKHFKVMKTFKDAESANRYRIQNKGIGPRGRLYVNKGSTLLNKFRGNQ